MGNAGSVGISGGLVTAAATVRLASAVFVPPTMNAPVVVTELFLTPTVVPVTLTEKVQLWPVLRFRPAMLMVPVPALPVMTPPARTAEQVTADKPLGVATTKPAGSASVKPKTPVEPPVLLTATLKVKLVLPLSAILDAPNALVKVMVNEGIPA